MENEVYLLCIHTNLYLFLPWDLHYHTITHRTVRRRGEIVEEGGVRALRGALWE